MKKTIFLIVIIALAYACEKINSSEKVTISEKTDSTEVSSSLIGKWTWFSTCGGMGDWPATCYTPDSTKTTKYLVFTQDSTYKYFYNDTLRCSSPFHTYCEVINEGLDTLYFIDYDSIITGPDWYIISHDTLTMRNVLGFALWTNRYKKVE